MVYPRFSALLLLSFMLVLFWIACTTTHLPAQQTLPVDFLDLAKAGSVKQVQEAINQGADLNKRDNDGRTPLMWAAARNPNPEVITVLLKAGADLNARDKDGWTSLMIAAWYNQSSEVITILLKAGADLNARGKYGWTPLMIAASYNDNPEVLTTLLRAGADLKALDEAGYTVLMHAALSNRNPVMIVTLLKVGADLGAHDANGRTALQTAVRNNPSPDIIITLLQAGADLNEPDTSGWVALMNASALNKNPEVITTLLQAGADLNTRDKDGWSPLMAAARYNVNPEVITTLLKAGADIRAHDKDGMTALMYAAWYNPNPKVITGLLDAGADADVKDQDGITAFVYAQLNDKLKGTVAYQRLIEATFCREPPVGLNCWNNNLLIHVYSGAAFELTYGDFVRVGAQNLDELGKHVSVGYMYFEASYHITASIFISPTNAGSATIDLIRSHYKEVKNGILALYKDVQLTFEVEDTYNFPSEKRFGISSLLKLEMNNEKAWSLVFLSGQKEWFILWRISFPTSAPLSEAMSRSAILFRSFDYSAIK